MSTHDLDTDSKIAPETAAPSRNALTGGIVRRVPDDLIPRLLRWALMAGALYLVFNLLWVARDALTPFVVGAILAYLLLPIVNRLTRYMPRSAAILVVYVLGIIALSTFFAYVVPLIAGQVRQLIEQIPSSEQIDNWTILFQDWYTRNVPPELREEIEAWLLDQQANLQANLGAYLQQVVNLLLQSIQRIFSTAGFLIGFFAVPFWLFYVLRDTNHGQVALTRLLHPRLRRDVWYTLRTIDRVFSGYIRGQLLLGVIIGTLCGFGLTILGMLGFEVPFILLLAIWAGLTELIPFIGPILGAIPAVLLGFTDGPGTGLAVLLLYFVVQQLEAQFLVPRVIGESVGLHPALLMVLLIVGSQVFGLLGVVLAAPVAATFRDLFVYVYGRLGFPLAATPAPEESMVPDTLEQVEPAPESSALPVTPPIPTENEAELQDAEQRSS